MSHRLELVWRGGEQKCVTASGEQSILEATEDEGVALPFGCCTGACATCTGKLIAGSVTHCRPPRALKDRHLESGYVLTCIAEPRDDCWLEVGAAVSSDLVTHP